MRCLGEILQNTRLTKTHKSASEWNLIKRRRGEVIVGLWFPSACQDPDNMVPITTIQSLEPKSIFYDTHAFIESRLNRLTKKTKNNTNTNTNLICSRRTWHYRSSGLFRNGLSAQMPICLDMLSGVQSSASPSIKEATWQHQLLRNAEIQGIACGVQLLR